MSYCGIEADVGKGLVLAAKRARELVLEQRDRLQLVHQGERHQPAGVGLELWVEEDRVAQGRVEGLDQRRHDQDIVDGHVKVQRLDAHGSVGSGSRRHLVREGAAKGQIDGCLGGFLLNEIRKN